VSIETHEERLKAIRVLKSVVGDKSYMGCGYRLSFGIGGCDEDDIDFQMTGSCPKTTEPFFKAMIEALESEVKFSEHLLAGEVENLREQANKLEAYLKQIREKGKK
jgi:hypothetical protein